MLSSDLHSRLRPIGHREPSCRRGCLRACRAQSGLGTQAGQPGDGCAEGRRGPSNRRAQRHPDRRRQRQRAVRKGNADDLVPPASLSKLMTAEVVFNEIKQGRLKPEAEFTVSTTAWRKGGAPSRTSSMFIAINSRVSVDDLLHGVIIQSGNDACMVLAEGISGNEAEFAELMTKRAREDWARQVDLRQFDRAARSAAAHDRARAGQARAATSSRPIRTTTNITASANSPGARSASTTAIPCSR